MSVSHFASDTNCTQALEQKSQLESEWHATKLQVFLLAWKESPGAYKLL